MIAHIRIAIQEEEGQAIVLGALMMLLLAFGIVVTLNLGHAVEEKIRLQNSADAAAYSMAVLEAQSFNYIAFTNRTQASHYNSMMLVHTMANFLVFVEGLLGTMVDFIWTLTTIVNAIAKILYAVFGIGAALEPLVQALNMAGKFLYRATTMLRRALYGTLENGQVRSGIIPMIGLLKQGMWYINYAQYLSTVLYSTLVGIKLAGGMRILKQKNLDNSGDVATGNGGASTGAFDAILQVANAGLNLIEYISVFDQSAGGAPFIPSLPTAGNVKKIRPLKPRWSQNTKYDSFKNREKEIRASQRIMAEIANGIRREREGTWAHKLFANNTRTGFNFPDDIGGGMLSGIIKKVINVEVGGQTKIVTHIPEPTNFEWPGDDISGLSVKRILNETPLDGNNAVQSREDHRFYQGSDSGADASHYQKTVGMRRPAGDVMGSFYGFNIWIGISLPVFGRYTLVDLDFAPALVSDRNGGRIYRWLLPPEAMVKSMDTPAKAYLRVPISAWDLIGPLQTVITTCLKGYFPPSGNGCKLSCKDMIWKVRECEGFPAGCCQLRKWLMRMRFPTFEKVKHAQSGNKKLQQFWMGIGPYMKFKPYSTRRMDHGQPSTWALVNLPPSQFMDGHPWNFDQSNYGVNFAPAGKNKKLTLNPRIDDGDPFRESRPLFVFGAGLNALARARVYYHRPGNWNEPPNFFNPYWRVQLAPISERLLPFVKKFQKQLNSTLAPVASALAGINTGISFIDNIVSGIEGILETLRKDGIARVLIGLIAH